MSGEHPNAALMRRLWEAGAIGDADTICDIYAPDVVLRAHGASGPLVGEYKGIAEVLDYLARTGEIVEDFRAELLAIYPSDSGAVIRYRSVAEGGGKHLDMEYLYEVAIARGRIVRATLVPIDQRRNDEFWRSQ